MGPRLFSRGWCSPRACRWTSCGRFNGAAAVQPRMAVTSFSCVEKLTLLQWGRGCSAADGLLW